MGAVWAHVCTGRATVSARKHTPGAQNVSYQDIHAPSLEQREPVRARTCVPT
jgi:hypothetical protein